MKKLLIYGAGFFDVVKLIEAINRSKPAWTILGFLDDTPELKGRSLNGYPVLGGRELLPEYVKQAETYFFNNVNGTRSGCRQIAELLASYQCRVPSLVHPAIDLSYVKVGSGCIIPEGCVLGANVTIGDHVTLRYGAVISHDVRIEDLVLIGPGATIGGRAVLKTGCTIGAGATVMREHTVGEFSTVGAGAVVTRDVAPSTTVAGVPAKNINAGGKS
jgi:sugar O-acyltransferase (sialic acid O-acetyltransferase NeuD family)